MGKEAKDVIYFFLEKNSRNIPGPGNYSYRDLHSAPKFK
jgi:hypothetical protein